MHACAQPRPQLISNTCAGTARRSEGESESELRVSIGWRVRVKE